jgi:hypothetical protein
MRDVRDFELSMSAGSLNLSDLGQVCVPESDLARFVAPTVAKKPA